MTDDRLAEAEVFLSSLAYDVDGTLRNGVLSLPVKVPGRSAYAPYFAVLDGDFDIEDVARRCVRYSGPGGANQYASVQLLRCVPEPAYEGHRPRGGAAHVAGLAAFFADVDIDNETRGRQSSGLPLPQTYDEAWKVLDGLPTPTLTVDTGGGIQAWWCLDCHAEIPNEEAARYCRGWGEMLVNHGRGLGLHVDQTGDLARVGRLPGGVNQKYGTLIRTVDSGPRYSLAALTTLLPPAPEPSEPAPPMTTRIAGAIEGEDAARITDRWSAGTDWSALLEPAGWTLYRDNGHGQRQWTRPGKSVRDGGSATSHDEPPVLHVYTSASELDANTTYTKLQFLAVVGHGGDMRAAWLAIAPPVDETTKLIRWVVQSPDNTARRLHWAAGRVATIEEAQRLALAAATSGGMSVDDAVEAAHSGYLRRGGGR